MKKAFKRIATLMLAVASVFTLGVGAYAANGNPNQETGPAAVADATIDTTRTGSFEIYKYDITQAMKDGVWDPANYKSTGQFDQAVNDALGNNANLDNNTAKLGNGETSEGYAIKGVEFTYLKVADITTYTKTEDGVDKIIVLYGFQKNDRLISILNLTAADRYQPADVLDNGKYFFESDTLVDAMAAILQESSRTDKKSALEAYIAENGGVKMTETDSKGYTKASDLPLGLYLLVETKVPEMVTSTVNPFFVSVPMTKVSGGFINADGSYTMNGSDNNDGGNRWLYDLTLYPKNETGIPSLEKTVREASYDTGKNGGSATDITDGYAHTATASTGDIVEYQIISTLPTITSDATGLSMYSFIDTIALGLKYLDVGSSLMSLDPSWVSGRNGQSYNGIDIDGVIIEFFKDKECTPENRVATWTERDATKKFEVTIQNAERVDSHPQQVITETNVMRIEMTQAGLDEINKSTTVYGTNQLVKGYSDLTLRITYKAVLDPSIKFALGDVGNDNNVYLQWERSNQNYYDTLVDDCHVYSYGIDLTKQFSTGNGDMSQVEFVIFNQTDGYYVQAVKNEAEGCYYVVDNAAVEDHACDEANATHFVPFENGKVIVKGLEDDTYTITEVRTDDGFTMLKDAITVVISTAEVAENCPVYTTDDLGVIQNDSRWTSLGQKGLNHKELTASATVDTNPVTMESVDAVDFHGDPIATSANALAPLTVLNTRGFDLPQTGGEGNWLFPVLGVSAMAVAGVVILLALKKKEDADEDAA